MRANTAEMQVEDKLLVPMVHAERSITRMTTIVSVEIPDHLLMECTDAHKAWRLILTILQPISTAFLEWWQRSHDSRYPEVGPLR